MLAESILYLPALHLSVQEFSKFFKLRLLKYLHRKLVRHSWFLVLFLFFSPSQCFVRKNKLSDDQSRARDNTAATTWPCFQVTKLFVIAILLYWLWRIYRRRDFNIFYFFWSQRLYYVVVLSLKIVACLALLMTLQYTVPWTEELNLLFNWCKNVKENV